MTKTRRQKVVHKALVAMLAILLAGCGGGGDDPGPAAKKPAPKTTPKPWRVVTHDPDSISGALLWNGLIGVRVGASGAGINAHDNAMPVFMIDEYHEGGEEKIQALSNPLGVSFEVDGHSTAQGPYANYTQDLNYKTGELRTSYGLQLANNRAYVRCSTYIHPTRRQIAQRWLVSMDREASVELRTFAAMNDGSTQKPDGHEFESVYRISALGTKARVRQALRTRAIGEWEPSEGGFTWKGTGRAMTPFTLERTVTFGLSAQLPKINAAKGLASGPSPDWNEPPPALTYDEIRRASIDAWEKRWETDIEIDGPVEDQQAVRSFLFYLRSAIHLDGDMSISPFALSNHQYNGHVFWDADIWVFPALALIDPAAASEIAEYRLGKEGQAHANFFETFWKDKALAGEVFGFRFPWESSVTGKETVPTTHQKEIHIGGSVAWMLAQASDLGLAENNAADRIRDGVGKFYLKWAEQTAPGKVPLELKDVMSPDENHVGDNDLYTNLLAQWAVNHGRWESKTTFKLPKDDQSFLTYDDDAVRGYKQAAAIWAVYPLQFPEAEKQAKILMERFADKVTPNGPAMSDSLHALIWARLGETDRAYETWQKSWKDFTSNPLLLFSEKRKKELTYFTTGAGGCLQTVIYGFLGFRLDYEKEPGAVWSKQLSRGRWLTIKPHLPKAWKSVKFKNFRVLGRTYTLTVTHQGAHVTEGD